MQKYDILEWVGHFDASKSIVNPKVDFLETDSVILYPGRFYVLEYFATTKERFNARPVIISLGVSKKDPDSFLCIDLSVIPYKARMRFIGMFFDIYRKEISENIEKFPFPEDAEKQSWMKTFSYESICKAVPMLPLKGAIKRYKIKNTKKIYALPFAGVYKVVGKYCDENYYVNGTISDVQKEFIKKMM